MGFHGRSLPSKYLGRPVVNSLEKRGSWMELLDNMKKNLMNWTPRPLNLASRMVMVKSVLQEILTYLQATLVALKAILKKIRNMQRDFLWSGNNEKWKWPLVNWEVVYTPKHHGGLGIRDLKKVSIVSGANLWWRWVAHDREPWVEVCHIKYAKGWDKTELIRFLEYEPRSHIWRTTWK